MIPGLVNHLWQSTIFACVVRLLILFLRFIPAKEPGGGAARVMGRRICEDTVRCGATNQRSHCDSGVAGPVVASEDAEPAAGNPGQLLALRIRGQLSGVVAALGCSTPWLWICRLSRSFCPKDRLEGPWWI